MKFGQLIWSIVARQTFFFMSPAKNEAGRLVPDLFLFFRKALYEVKASGLQISCIILR